MAAHADHVTQTADDDDIPSIFDVLAQDSLSATLRPALNHAFRVIAERKPASCGWLYRFSDEIYMTLDLWLQTHFLNKYSGSFAEKFYDLKRTPVAKEENNGTEEHSLPKHVVRRSLFYLAVVPYIKHKLDQLFEHLQRRVLDGMYATRRILDRLIQIFVCVYPYVHCTWEATMLYYQFLYAVNKSDYHSPFLRLAGVKLERLSEDDIKWQNREKIYRPMADMSMKQKLIVICKRVVVMATLTLSSSLSMGVFFLQFLDWWYTSDQNTAKALELPIPDPPEPLDMGRLGELKSLCPLCHRVRTNDTALSVSGVVFCYPCILSYVRQHGRCPITNYPATADHLVKLYVEDS